MSSPAGDARSRLRPGPAVVILSRAVIGIGVAARLWPPPDRRGRSLIPATRRWPGSPLSPRGWSPRASTANGLKPDDLPDAEAVKSYSPRSTWLDAARGGSGSSSRRDRGVDCHRGRPRRRTPPARARRRPASTGSTPRPRDPPCAFESLPLGRGRVCGAALLDPFVSALDALYLARSSSPVLAGSSPWVSTVTPRGPGGAPAPPPPRDARTLERELGWLVEVGVSAGGTRVIAATIVDPTRGGGCPAAADLFLSLRSASAGTARRPTGELVHDDGHHGTGLLGRLSV